MQKKFYKEVEKHEKKIKKMIQQEQKKENLFYAYKSKCEHCGKTLVLPSRTDRVVCNVCGYYIYRNPEVKEEYVKKEKQDKFEKMLKKYLKETNDDYQNRRGVLGRKRNPKNPRNTK